MGGLNITDLINDANRILIQSIEHVKPEAAVINALKNHDFGERVTVIAIGKAAWRMAKAAYMFMPEKILNGIVVTKYNYVLGEISNFEIVEAGHPVPDEKSIEAARKVLELLNRVDVSEILLLISGGGSSLFELPEGNLSLDDLQNCTNTLLKSGASINEINMIRKRLSAVKGGKLLKYIGKKRAFQVVLSDIVGDDLSMVASGPAYPDSSTCEETLSVLTKYNISFSDNVTRLLRLETPKDVCKIKTVINGSVRELCEAAKNEAQAMGYNSYVLTTDLCGEAKSVGTLFGNIAKSIYRNQTASTFQLPCIIIMGGETTVRVKGTGLGGRNQEIVLSAISEIKGLNKMVLVSIGSDGTDGPTDAAGGIVDGDSYDRLVKAGISPEVELKNNNSYYALDTIGALIKTGPTGTNVNDITFMICQNVTGIRESS